MSNQVEFKNNSEQFLNNLKKQKQKRLEKSEIVQSQQNKSPKLNDSIQLDQIELPIIKIGRFQEYQNIKQSNQNIDLNKTNIKEYQIDDHTKYKNKQYSSFMRQNILRKSKQIESRKIKVSQNIKFKQQNIEKIKKQKQGSLDQQSFIDLISNIQWITGRTSTIWLFILRNPSQNLLNKIKNIYKNLLKKSYLMPLCYSVNQAIIFLKSSKLTFFKIIMDLQNGEQFIKISKNRQIQEKIKSIYILNNDQIKGITRSQKIRKQYPKKVRGTVTDLDVLLKQVARDVQNGNKFVLSQQSNQKQIKIQEVRCASKLPTFIQLSGQDKTEVTQYRTNLYGAIKIQQKQEIKQKLEQFKIFVSKIYAKDKQQLQNLQKYVNQISHQNTNENGKQNQTKHYQILRFYVDQTFYYKVLNNVLRFCRTIQEFRPITLSFHQNYNAIKYFYNKTLFKHNNVVSAKTLYRGCPIIQKDLELLQQGKCIQLLGFISTTKNQKYAIDHFIRNKGDYLFIIEIKQRKINDQMIKYDHGFVQLSQFNIASPQFIVEQEVLINALNIYRVKKVIRPQNSQNNLGRIYLQYGTVFELKQKYEKDEELNVDQKGVLDNYKYCMRLMDNIQDQGDVLMIAQQFDKCKQFYKMKLQNGQCEDKKKVYNKIAYAQYKCGQTDEARLNALKSMEQYQKQLQLSIAKGQTLSQQKCLKIFELNSVNAQILKQRQDTLNAKKALNFQLDLLQKFNSSFDQIDKILFLAQTLQERASIFLKQGNIQESRKDVIKAQQLIQKYKNSFIIKQQQIQKKYFYKSLYSKICCFFSQNLQVLEQRKRNQLQEIKKKEIEFNKVFNKIQECLIKINQIFKQIYKVAGNKNEYQKYALKAKQLYAQIKSENIYKNPFNEIKLKVIEAKIQNAIQKKQNVEHSYQLLEQAIGKIKQIQPMNLKVADLNSLLGKFKQRQFDNNLILPSSEQQEVNQNDRKFPYEQQKKHFQQISTNYNEALDILQYHHSENHPKVFQVRNNIGKLNFTFSKLQQSKNQANTILIAQNGPRHSQGAKAALLLAKIHLAKGQIKISFSYIQRSTQILKISIIKEEINPEYLKLYQNSPLYLQIQLQRSRLYNRQLKHDLALPNLKKIEKIAKLKLKNIDGGGYLSDIYQQLGNTLIHQKDMIKFQDYYKKAIQFRQNQMGKNNILNAISLCTLFKYLLFVQDFSTAQKCLNQSSNIFSHFPIDHPNYWIQKVSLAYFSEKKNEMDKYLDHLRQSIKLLSKRYSKSHITFLKMKAKYANVLQKSSNYQQAYLQFKQLQRQLQDDIAISQSHTNSLLQTEDEKIGIKKYIQQSIRTSNLELKISNIRKQTLNINNQYFHGLSNKKIDITNDSPLPEDLQVSRNQLIENEQIAYFQNSPQN